MVMIGTTLPEYPGLQYTMSVYAKAVERSQIFLTMTGQSYALFDLAAGLVVSNPASDMVSLAITSAGNGWYRCSATFTPGITDHECYIGLYNSGSVYTGTAGSGVLLWGVQLENALYDLLPGSLIVTNGGSATAQDIGPGTLVVEATVLNSCPATTQMGFAIFTDTTSAEQIVMLDYLDLVGMAVTSNFIGSSSNNLGSGYSVKGIPAKYGISFAENTTICCSAGASQTLTGGALPKNISSLIIGRSNSAVAWTLNGYIKRVLYWPRALPLLELQQFVS
jgi:hypothetical protein